MFCRNADTRHQKNSPYYLIFLKNLLFHLVLSLMVVRVDAILHVVSIHSLTYGQITHPMHFFMPLIYLFSLCCYWWYYCNIIEVCLFCICCYWKDGKHLYQIWIKLYHYSQKNSLLDYLDGGDSRVLGYHKNRSA